MAITTDNWIGTAGADWGASSSNWSKGLPTSNNNVVINTKNVLTVTYGGGDTYDVNSLTVGNDVFDMSGGSLTITTTASFADGFTQTGGTLMAGGKVTVTGAGTLTGGIAEGNTAFVFDGTVALGNYTLGGATSLSNKKTTNLTGQITLGDDTGVNATINNEKGAIFDIGGDFGVTQGAATAQFVNAGTFEKTGGTGTSFIGVDFTDTGRIVVATAGTIEFGGPANRFTGMISGAGQIYLGSGGKDTISAGTKISTATFTVSDSSTVVSLDGSLAYAKTFNLQNSAVLDLAGNNVTLTLSGTSFLGNSAALDAPAGSGTLVTAAGSTTNVGETGTFFLGGGMTWENSGTVGESYTLQLGDSTFNPATFINERGGKYEFAADVGIQPGAALDSSFINLAGAVIEKTGGGNSTGSVISVDVTDDGTVIVKTGIIDFAGNINSFFGAISGAGQFAIGGGDNVIASGAAISSATFGIYNAFVTLGEKLVYGGTTGKSGIFNLESGAALNLGGFSLSLSGSDTFTNATVEGTGTLITNKGSAISLGGFTLGGATTWENSGTVSEFNTFQVGDPSFDRASFINEKGGVFDFVVANVGVTQGAVITSSFTNDGLVENTSNGDAVFSLPFINNGSVDVKIGEIEFAQQISGSGSFSINRGTVMRFDSIVAKGVTVDFATRTGGDLLLADSESFSGAIKGFGGTNTDEIELKDINFTSGSFTMSYKGTATQGVLTLFDGTHEAHLTFLGKYSLNDFQASADATGGTLIQEKATPHALFASAH